MQRRKRGLIATASGGIAGGVSGGVGAALGLEPMGYVAIALVVGVLTPFVLHRLLRAW
jgi:hypothetical protein